MKKSTTEEFIEKAKEIHGDKYDYSLVEYKNARTEIKIICPNHGEFKQIANHHIGGCRCSKCYNISSEEFIEKSKKIHGDKYDYSLVNFIDKYIKVKIICPDHGIFEKTPYEHLKNIGCKKCKYITSHGNNKLTTEIFIERANKIHNNEYDYSLIEYNNYETKIKIICPNHGIFEQSPASHLKGHKCSKCSGKMKYTTDEFIENSEKIHGKKYDYSLVEYKNKNEKVKIICLIHGIFEQSPSSHCIGDGCPSCSNKFGLSKEEFIKRSNIKHKHKYDYSLTEYKNVTSKVKIICSKHGIFEQVADSHMRGKNCKKCSIESRTEKRTMKLSEFIIKANKVHNNKYNYSLTNYKNSQTKIKIICPEHGIFYQTPASHLSNIGCPECSKYYGGFLNKRFLYLFYDNEYNLMKIGLSNNPKNRLNKIKYGNNVDIIILKEYKNCGHLEQILHKKYDEFRQNHPICNEGKTEWFNLNKDEVYNIDVIINENKSY